MPTEKPRITLAVSPETLEAINDYRFEWKFRNQTMAVLDLIDRGLKSRKGESAGLVPSLSDDAMRLARDYDRLGPHDQKILRQIADLELERPQAMSARPLAAYSYQGEPLDLSAIQPIRDQEVEKSDIDF